MRSRPPATPPYAMDFDTSQNMEQFLAIHNQPVATHQQRV